MNSLHSFPIPFDLSLETDRVLMRPMIEADFDTFLPLAQDPDTWTYFSLNLADPSQLGSWMDTAFRERAANIRRPFTILDKASGQVAGSMSLGNISHYDLRLEIGWSWLGAEFKGSGVNRHSKFAMMRYTFEQLRFWRIEFKTDVLNRRARRGLENIGGQQEGILRSHMTMWNERRRDSVMYSVLQHEWTGLKQTIFKDLSS